MAHGHTHCHHDLKFCAQCDITYCVKCSKEWGACHQPHYWYWPNTTYPYSTTTTTYGDTTSVPTGTVTNSHAHN